MDRIIAPNSVDAAHADTAPVTGTPGYATDGNPATGVPATLWAAYQYNAIQEELIAFLTAAGVAPDRTDNAQILAACRALFAAVAGSATQTFNVAAATALTHAPEVGQVQRSAFNYAGLAGGTANALTATLNIAPGSYTDYLLVTVRVASTNTGSVSLNVNGLGVVPVIGLGHQVLQGGELFAGGFATFAYSANYDEAILLTSTGGPQQIAAATQSAHAVQLQQIGHGQCRLSVASTTSLKLAPYNGNNVIVNGIPLQLPSAGITVSNSGLSASTLYYVYLAGTTASPSLVLSATGHAAGTNGVEVMSGDASKTLVGMIYTNASTQFVDSLATRFCLNWFNRRKIVSTVAPTGGPYSFTSQTAVELTTSARAQFLNWADDMPIANIGAYGSQTSGTPSATTLNFQLYMDGTTAYGPALGAIVQPSWNIPVVQHGAFTALSEGFHYSTIFVNVGANGGTLSVNNVQNTVNIFG